MADWSFDDITARAVDAAVKGQFDANLKTQDMLNAVRSALTGTTQVLLYRDGVAVTPIPLTGSPTIAGSTLSWPARNVTVDFALPFDIDSGTWTGRISTSAGRYAVAATVGKTTGVIRVSGDIVQGPSTVTLGPITMTAPDLGTGSGGGGGGGSFTAGSPPGSGWTEILAAGGTPIVVPANFAGWHRYFNLSPQVSPYPYKTHRAHDQRGVTDDVSTILARMRPNATTWNRQYLDEFLAQTPGKTRILTIFGTPTWARKYTDTTAYSGAKYPSFPDAACAPVDGFVASVVDRIFGAWGYTASDFPFIEAWNEPSFGYSGGGQYLDPVAGQRWTDANNPLRGQAMFFNGTHVDLARIAQECKQNVPGGVTVMGCGFELGLESNGSTRMFNPRLFAEAGGMNWIDWFTYHSYIYSYNPAVVTSVRTNVRNWLNSNGQSSKPMANSETGFEYPGPAFNRSDAEIASYAIRMFVRSAVAGDKMFVAYQDRGNQDIYNNPQGPTFKNPTGSSVITAALTTVDALNGRTIRQAQFNSDGRVWVRFSDNTEILG